MNHDLQVSILKELLRQLDAGENIDAGVQYKMSTDVYACPEIAAKEREQFFRQHPQLIGLSGDKLSEVTEKDFIRSGSTINGVSCFDGRAGRLWT